MSEDDESGRGPAIRLTVAEVLTPLPEIDAALAHLQHLGSLTHGSRARYRLAVLRALQQDGAGRWRTRQIQSLVPWLDKESATSIVGDLRHSGLLVRDEIDRHHRMPPRVRVLIALVDALSVTDVPLRSMVRMIGHAMALARTTGAGEDVILGQFRSAIAHLRAGGEELRALMADHSDAALREAGEVVRENAEAMKDLLREHQDFFVAHRGDTRFLDLEHDALSLIASVGGAAAEAVTLVSGVAGARLRMTGRIDRSELREVTSILGERGLAALVAGLTSAPPGVGIVDAATAFEALAEASQRTAPSPPRLPRVTAARRSAPADVPSHGEAMARELRALTETTAVADIVARVDWPTAVARNTDLVDAYTRFANRLPELELRDVVERVGTAGVARASASRLIVEEPR